MHLLPAFRYVAAGGALGALTRWAVTGMAGDEQQRVAIFVLNVVGSFLLGVLVGASRTRGPDGRRRVTGNQFLLVGTGFCGALTSFSAFAVDVARSLDQGAVVPAAVTGFGTIVTVVAGAGVGFRIGSGS